MSRFRRVIHSVASGYFMLVAAAVYSFALFPLGLHFLSKERLGLWFLMATIAGYLSQIDLGMSSSLARLLIDHKDDREGTAYGSLIQTGWLVLVVQGCIIGLLGFVLAPLLAPVLRIEPELRADFIALMRWMTFSLALSFFTKIFSHLLQAHQRIDLINYSQVLNLIISFALVWILFLRHEGVLSLAWATVVTTMISNLLLFFACRYLHLLPAYRQWGRPSWRLFKGIFAFGKDIFLVSVGTQLIMASQPMILTRELGVASATLWYAGTRVFNFVCQVIWRISDVSMPAFSEMMVRGEEQLLRERYKSILVITASLSGFAAISFALCNSLFIIVWTSFSRKATLDWASAKDTLLALWMIILAILHCHNNFVLCTKQVGFMRYVYFVEGTVFVVLGLLGAKWLGLAGLIASSVVCSACFSGAYGVWRVSRYFGLPARTVAFGWLAPMARVIVPFGIIGLVTWFASALVVDPLIRLGIHVLICASAGFAILLRFGVPGGLQRELMQRAPASFNPILRRVFTSPSR